VLSVDIYLFFRIIFRVEPPIVLPIDKVLLFVFIDVVCNVFVHKILIVS
jgi:hypothetical protein